MDGQHDAITFTPAMLLQKPTPIPVPQGREIGAFRLRVGAADGTTHIAIPVAALAALEAWAGEEWAEIKHLFHVAP